MTIDLSFVQMRGVEVWFLPNDPAARPRWRGFVLGGRTVAKTLDEVPFKILKLGKTRRRRRSLDSERRLANSRETCGRNDPQPPLELRQVATKSLNRSAHRVRRTTPQQLERVAASIAEFGFCDPILVCGSEIIDGEIRHEVAQRLGLETVPVIDCSHLSDVEVRKLRLALGRIAELGEYDMDKLKIEFSELIELDQNLIATGFTSKEIDIVLTEAGAGKNEAGADGDGAGDPPDAPTSQLGDIWDLDGNRVICANALEPESYEALLNGELAHAILTDPPYNVPISGNVSGLGKKVHDEFVMASGELDGAQWQQFLDTLFLRLVAVLTPSSVLFVFMDWRSIYRVYAAGFAANLKIINLAVWYKEAGAMGTLYRSAHELVAVFCKGDKPHTNNVELGRHGRDRQNVWCAPGANRRGSSANEMLKLHATPKPVELCVDAILDVTERGQIVLDVFLGSGTTLIAAEKTGRRCFGMELDPRFVDVSVTRWMKLTGREAILAATGETFLKVAARRADEAATPGSNAG